MPIIHINQVAYERNGPKSAIVYVEGNKRGFKEKVERDPGARAGFDVLRFEVLNKGKAVLAGVLSELPKFTEWAHGHYFKADFSQLKHSGDFTIRVSVDGVEAVSAEFSVLDNACFAKTAAAILAYFTSNRHTDDSDRHRRIYDTDRYVDVRGGWMDASGETGKYLSHLSYANFMNPQQMALIAWALAASYECVPHLYTREKLQVAVVEEALWGADYFHRILSPEGFFYLSVFDRWGDPTAERVITGYEGIDGAYTDRYQAAFRKGAGVAIAALARAYVLSKDTGVQGQYTAAQYLQDAERAHAHLCAHNHRYCDDGKENIIDDYTALLAAVELYKATGKRLYLQAARRRAGNLNRRMSTAGWFICDDHERPFFHGAEAGFPVVSLSYYIGIEADSDLTRAAKETIKKALEYQLALNNSVANPFNYARQSFRTYANGVYSDQVFEGFFMPHENESGYWWQGESARLASLATAAILGGRLTMAGAFGVSGDLAEFAQNQIDWTLGRNPFGMCMLTGFGVKNPPFAESAGRLIKGGISNGITGREGSAEGRGIAFAPGPDANNWRWVEQWTPHAAWFLLAVAAMAAADEKDVENNEITRTAALP